MPLKVHRIAHHKRRPLNEAHAPTEAHEAAAAPDVALLHDSAAPNVRRALAIAVMQRAAGNAAVERALAQRQTVPASRPQRGRRWRPQPVRPELIDRLLQPDSPLWRQLNPDASAAVNCPATAAAVDEYLSTGQINPAPAGDVFSEFRFETGPWSSFTRRFADIRSVVSAPNTFVVVEGRRSKAYVAANNIPPSHWFVVVNRNGIRGLDAYGEGQVINDLNTFIREQGFTQFRYYRGSFRVQLDPDAHLFDSPGR